MILFVVSKQPNYKHENEDKHAMSDVDQKCWNGLQIREMLDFPSAAPFQMYKQNSLPHTYGTRITQKTK